MENKHKYVLKPEEHELLETISDYCESSIAVISVVNEHIVGMMLAKHFNELLIEHKHLSVSVEEFGLVYNLTYTEEYKTVFQIHYTKG